MSSWDWKILLRPNVLEVTRTHHVWPKLVGHPDIDHESMLANKEITITGQLYQHIETTINLNRKGWSAYKFGVTTDPVNRWENFGDYKMKFQKMHLLLCTSSKHESDALEAFLIRMFKYEKCQNKKPGGEGPRREDPPHFTYVVTVTG